MTERPAIPSPIKRVVRQNCGFGCVICGALIYDYEHIEEYSKVQEHTAENLVLLCPSCHRRKTNGLLTKEMVRDALAASRSRERVGPERLPEQHYKLDVGSNLVSNFRDGVVFSIIKFGWLELTFSEGRPSLNGEIFDGNGNSAIVLQDNVYTLSSNTWDIEFVGSTLTFRNGLREVFATITFDVERKLITLRGNIALSDCVRLTIRDEGIFANDENLAVQNLIHNTSCALLITNKQIPYRPFVTGAHVIRNTFSGSGVIFCLNIVKGARNVVDQADFAFVWTVDFLESLAVT